MNGLKLQETLETLYPNSYAESWDNVGLQVGTMKKVISGVLISLDLTMEVIDEAIKNKMNLIICHHPAIFNPLKDITSDTYLGKMIHTLIKNDISLYIVHTNFDVSRFGMNMILGKKLGLLNMEFFDEIDEEFGLGVIGQIKHKRADDFIADIKSEFGIDTVKYIGDLKASIEVVALIGGSGSSYLYQAIDRNVDLFITGDVTYHKALDAKNLGLNLLDVGHYFESHGIKELREILIAKGFKMPIKVSNIITNPYKNV